MPAGVTISGANNGTCGVGDTTTVTAASGTTLNPGSCNDRRADHAEHRAPSPTTTGTLSTSSGSAPPASAPLTVTTTAPTLGETIAPATGIAVGSSATLTITVGNPNGAPITLERRAHRHDARGRRDHGRYWRNVRGRHQHRDHGHDGIGAPPSNPGGCTIVVPDHAEHAGHGHQHDGDAQHQTAEARRPEWRRSR